MGALIVISGISGVGKTTFARLLADRLGMPACLEQLQERPFHQQAADGSGSMLANQMDFLLYRAEQEKAIRSAKDGGVVDGGLEMDFHLFTCFFHQRGLLHPAEFTLCQRFYQFTRILLPPPEVIIHLEAPLQVVASRFIHRSRAAEVTRLDDLSAQRELLQAWLISQPDGRVLTLSTGDEDPNYSQALVQAVSFIRERMPF
jgi:deoxyadenosine/deoxycytidine kinase